MAPPGGFGGEKPVGSGVVKNTLEQFKGRAQTPAP